MKRVLPVLLALLWSASAYAQPTLGSVATLKAATNVVTTIAVPDVDAGNAIVLIYNQTGNSARTATVTDECGHIYGSPAVSSPAYTSGRATAVWVIYASTCTDSSLVITLTQAGGSLASYSLQAFELDGDTAADTSSSVANTAATTHHASADANTIDTAVNSFIFTNCTAQGSLGTEGVAVGWTAFTESNTQIMGQYRTSTGALTNERGTMTSTTARDSQCIILSIKSTAAPDAVETHYVCADAANDTCGGQPDYTTISAALAAAEAGEIVCLKAGETFAQTTVTLPDKGNLASPITIRSCAADSALPPPGVRITTAYNAQLPIWKATQNNTAAVDTETSAQDYIIKFIRFQCDPIATQDVIRIGFNSTAQQLDADQPRDFVIDQVIVEGDTIKGCKRGVSMHGENITVKNSYFTKINSVGQDGQCIWGANGWGPYTIQNNYCDGATEPVMFGGTDNQMRTTATCAASPAPTTTGCTLENYRVGHTIATLAVNQLMAIQTGAAAREHVRAATINGDIVTWTPALTVAPTEANCGLACDIRWGAMPEDVLIERNHFTRPAGYWLPPLATPTNFAAATSNAAGTLTAGEYCYRVNALAPGYGSGNNSFSTAAAEKCATLDATGQVILTWQAVTNATKYRVYGRSRGGQTMYWEVTAPTVTYTDTGSAGTTSTVPNGTVFQVKNAFEHKFGNRFTVRYNIFENVRSSTAGDGTAVWLKSGNSDESSEFSETTDFTFEYNVIRHAAGCIKFSSAEEGGTNLERPSPITNMTVRHNLCYDTGPQWRHDGAGTWIAAATDYGLAMKNFTFEHNTMIGTRYAFYFQANPLQGTNVMRNNLFPATASGIRADGVAAGSVTLTAFNIGTFTNNLLAGITLSAYPATTLTLSQALFAAEFANYGGTAITDYALNANSIYRTAAHDGSSLGADIATLASAVDGVEQGVPVGAPIFITTSLPGGTDDTPYLFAIQTTSGTGVHTFTLDSGTLPTGVTLSTAGVLSGTPTTAATYDFVIAATDEALQQTTQAYSVVIAAASVGTLTITTTDLADSTTAEDYNAPLTATGGAAAYSWTISAGSLPVGWSLGDTSGVISGRAQASGVYQFTVQATSGNLSDTQDFEVTITFDGGATPGPGTKRRPRMLNGQEWYTFSRDDCSALTTADDDVRARDRCIDANLNEWVVTATSPTVTVRSARLPPERVTVTVDGATTFAVPSSDYFALACTGAETINTITGGVAGQTIYIEFTDTDCTQADDDAATASNATDLTGTATNNTGAANEMLILFYTGAHWLQIGGK